MQTSLKPSDWIEHSGDEQDRMRLRPESPHLDKRRLFPLSAKLSRPSSTYNGVAKDHLFMYARTKLTPACFPIEVLHWTSAGHRSYMTFRPDEVDLLPPQD